MVHRGGWDKLGSRLSALGSRLSALGSRLSALGSRLSALGSRLSALGSRLSALGSRLSALGSRLSALGSRLSALGSRLSALGSRLSGSRLSALGSRLSILSALAASCRIVCIGDGVQRSCATLGMPASRTAGHTPLALAGTASSLAPGPSPLRLRGEALAHHHRPAAGQCLGQHGPGCAVTVSLVAYSAGKSHRLKPRPRPPSRVNRFLRRISYKEVLHECNAYNFTTSIGIPRTACKFDEYEVSPTRPAPSTVVPRDPSRTGANRARASRATGGTRGEIRPMRIGVRSGAGAVPGALHHGAELED